MDEVDARDLVLPPGAEAGMSVTWRHRGSGGPDDDLAVRARVTVACAEEPLPLAPIVRMEWDGMDYVLELVAVARSGAAPSLSLPE